jgi:hypothetical protein
MELIGVPAPLDARGPSVSLKAETGRLPLLPACARTLREVDAIALPGGVQHLGDRGRDAFGGVGDRQLDAAQAAVGLRRNAAQNVSASEGPISSPRISRRPSLLTPTATITATEMMRPGLAHFDVGGVDPQIQPCRP